jgi:hypothetical protein
MALRAATTLWLVLGTASGCMPSSVMGPLQHERDERDRLLARASKAGISDEALDKLVPPLTPEEELSTHAQNHACRAHYMWKNGLTWTGSVFVAVAAGFTIGAAYSTQSSNDTNATIAYGVSAGSLAALGSIFVAVGGIVQQAFTDRGCWVK